MTASFDFTHDGTDDLVVGRDDGTIECITFDDEGCAILSHGMLTYCGAMEFGMHRTLLQLGCSDHVIMSCIDGLLHEHELHELTRAGAMVDLRLTCDADARPKLLFTSTVNECIMAVAAGKCI